MATFGITPVTGYPLPPSDDFPQFIQFQAAGVDLGGPDADTVNFSTGATATRGTGENSNVITVTASGGGGGSSIQFQSEGVDVGTTSVNTVNFAPGFILTLEGDTLTVEPFPALFTWTTISNGGNEYSVTGADIGQGLILTDVSSVDLPGAGGFSGYPVTILNTSGVPIPITSLALLRYAARYTASIEDGGTVQIRSLVSGEWSLTGDLTLAP